MPARFLEQSPLCPIPFYELGSPVSTDFSVPNFKSEPFATSLEHWMQRRKSFYFQKWQMDDSVCIQFGLPAQGPTSVTVSIVTCGGQLLSTVVLDQIFTAVGNLNNGSPVTIYQYKWRYGNLTYNGQPLPAGRYLVQIRVDYGDLIKYYISEPQQIGQYMPDTIPIDYSHDLNEYNTFFSLNPNFRVRVEGQILFTNLKYRDVTYTEQANETDLLDSETADMYELTIGAKGRYDSNPGVPKWMLYLVGKIFMLRFTAVKGRLYVRQNGEELEVNSRYPTDLHIATLALEAKEPELMLTLGIADLYITDIPATYPYALSPLSISNGVNVVNLAGGVPREVTNLAGITLIMTQLNSTLGLSGQFFIESGALYYRNGPLERYTVAGGETFAKSMLFGIQTIIGQQFSYSYNGGAHISSWNGSDARLKISTAFLPAGSLLPDIKTNLPQNTSNNTLRIYHKDNLNRLVFTFPTTAASLNSLPSAYSAGLTHLTIQGQFALTQFSLPSLNSIADSIKELRINSNGITTLTGTGWSTPPVKKFANLSYVDFRGNDLPPTPDQEKLIVDFVQNAAYYATPGFWLMENQGNGPVTGTTVQNINFMMSAGWQVSYDQ